MIRLLLVVLIVGCGLHAADQEQSERLYFKTDEDSPRSWHEHNLRHVFDLFLQGYNADEHEWEEFKELAKNALAEGVTFEDVDIDINRKEFRSLPYGDKYEETLLTAAAYRGDYEMVCWLLEHGACPNAVEGQFSALERAFGVKKPWEIVEKLLSKGAQESYPAGSVKGSLLDRACQCFDLCSSELGREFIRQSYVPQWRTMIVELNNRGLPYGDKYQDVIDRVLAEHEDAQVEEEALSDDV